MRTPERRGSRSGAVRDAESAPPEPERADDRRSVRTGRNDLDVRGLALLDGTPVLDVKPYVRSIPDEADVSFGGSTTSGGRSVQVLRIRIRPFCTGPPRRRPGRVRRLSSARPSG
ncbi:TrmO family methyltransferase domain-containing protein [Halorientalis salina]|uniref:TrmO family methyltransferase domain-containing protein n=1 Tax=Halorientalis salina TaxID=2932266 RepID=UPI00351D790C